MIVSRQNQKIKNIRRLRRCKGETAILEGPHLVEDALSLGLDFEEVLATPDFMRGAAGRKLERRLSRAPLLVEARLLDELADADSPRGLLAVVRLPRSDVESIHVETAGIFVVADRIQDPGNLGALARSVEAGGGAALLLTRGSVNPNHARALRASAGSLLRLPVAVDVDIEDLRRRFSENPPEVLALVAHEGEDLYQLEVRRPLILLVGAEGPGLSERMLAAADRRVTIPLRGRVESLNAAVAAAVALFELERRARRPGE